MVSQSDIADTKKKESDTLSQHLFLDNAMIVSFSSLFAIGVVALVAFYGFGIKRIGSDSDRFYQTSISSVRCTIADRIRGLGRMHRAANPVSDEAN